MADLTTILAIVGGISGPLSLLVSYLAFRRDAEHVRVRLLKNQKITQGQHDNAVRQALERCRARGAEPPMSLYIRDPDKVWAIIQVSNVGRRRVIIMKVLWVPRSGSAFIIAGGFLADREWLPATLEESQSRDFPIEESQMNGPLAVLVTDSVGRSHYGGFERSLAGMRVQIMNFFRIKPYR